MSFLTGDVIAEARVILIDTNETAYRWSDDFFLGHLKDVIDIIFNHDPTKFYDEYDVAEKPTIVDLTSELNFALNLNRKYLVNYLISKAYEIDSTDQTAYELSQLYMKKYSEIFSLRFPERATTYED